MKDETLVVKWREVLQQEGDEARSRKLTLW